jgi:hypothetical protein
MKDVVMVTILFGIPSILLILLVAGLVVTEHRKDRMKFEERRLMIERGLTPPEDPSKLPRTPDHYLRRGVVLLFLGLGLVLSPVLLLDISPGSFGRVAAASGIVIGLLGVGNLVYYRLSRRAGEPVPQGGPEGPPLHLGDRT